MHHRPRASRRHVDFLNDLVWALIPLNVSLEYISIAQFETVRHSKLHPVVISRFPVHPLFPAVRRFGIYIPICKFNQDTIALEAGSRLNPKVLLPVRFTRGESGNGKRTIGRQLKSLVD